jgi:hypothetical protein
MTKEKLEEKFTLEVVQSVPERFRDKIKPGEMLINAHSIHKTFLEQPWQTELAVDSLNNRLLWRHRDPENPALQGLVFGRNLEETVGDDGFSDAWYRVFGGPEGSPEKTIQKLIKLRHDVGEPIGISKGFIKHYNKNGEIRRVVALEDSITYKPQCNQCTTQEVIIQMEDKDKVIKEQIDKLQEELNDTKLQLEAKDKTIAEKDETMKTLETERSSFKDKLDELESKLNSTKDEKSSMEDKFVQLNDAFKKFKLESLTAQKTPIIDKILIHEDSSMKDVLRDIYLGYTTVKLEERLEEVEIKSQEATILTKTLDKERNEALDNLKAKDVGMNALQVKGNNLKMAEAVELEMKAEGLI